MNRRTTMNIGAIDFKLLREQKGFLLNHGGAEAMGLACLLDHIQDCAVEEYGMSIVEVFGEQEDE
jgi:UDP-N-acetylenolpyruvoylglucosamine reductase